MKHEIERLKERCQQIEVAMTTYKAALDLKIEDEAQRLDKLEKTVKEMAAGILSRASRDSEISGILTGVKDKIETLEAKWEGLSDAATTMCHMMDNLINNLGSIDGPAGDLAREIAKSMNADMEKKYQEKVKEVFDCVVDLDEIVGDHVLCDLCGKDWTDSETSGGFLFAGRGVCPDCAPDLEDKATEEGEDHFIQSRCPPQMSHAEWMRSVIRPALKGNTDIRSVADWKKEGGHTDE